MIVIAAKTLVSSKDQEFRMDNADLHQKDADNDHNEDTCH